MKLIICISKFINTFIIFIYSYSALGNQVYSQKTSAPKASFNKANKDKANKCGMFPSQMSNKPTKIRLPHPNF